MTIAMSEYAASVVARVRCVTTFDAEGFPARKVGCNPRHQAAGSGYATPTPTWTGPRFRGSITVNERQLAHWRVWRSA
jgi:hypothetical protein